MLLSLLSFSLRFIMGTFVNHITYIINIVRKTKQKCHWAWTTKSTKMKMKTKTKKSSNAWHISIKSRMICIQWMMNVCDWYLPLHSSCTPPPSPTTKYQREERKNTQTHKLYIYMGIYKYLLHGMCKYCLFKYKSCGSVLIISQLELQRK